MIRRQIIRFGLLGATACVLAWQIGKTFNPSVPAFAEAKWISSGTASDVPAMVRSLRPIYPYSVIPGGVFSARELRSAADSDSLVRDHYQGFNLHAAYLVKTTAARDLYVSYRKEGRVYWTARRLQIPKGELLITDGRSFARTRCGNRLSESPGSSTASQEASPQLLSMPPLTLDRLRNPLITFATPEAASPQSEALLSAKPRFAPQLVLTNLDQVSSEERAPVMMIATPGMPRLVTSGEYISSTTAAHPPDLALGVGTPISTRTGSAIAQVPEPSQLFSVGTLLILLAGLLRKVRLMHETSPVNATGGGNLLRP